MPTYPMTETAARQQRAVKGSCGGAHGHRYSFTYEYTSTGWRIYIDRQPGYSGRAEDGLRTHRFGVGSRPSVCWTRQITTLDDAQKIARLWADCTDHYIATGRFESGDGRVTARGGTRRLLDWLFG